MDCPIVYPKRSIHIDLKPLDGFYVSQGGWHLMVPGICGDNSVSIVLPGTSFIAGTHMADTVENAEAQARAWWEKHKTETF